MLSWPGKSPDLNPIENLWGIMEQEVTQQSRVERPSADQLWARIEESWNGLRTRSSLFESLSDSMVRRLEDLVVAAGGLTKY